MLYILSHLQVQAYTQIRQSAAHVVYTNYVHVLDD